MIIFKAIDGYPRYEVSNTGQVRRVEDGSLLEGGLSSQGYPKVKLTNEDGDRRNENVHVLMARAFYGEIPGARIVHLNGCKTDNRLGNLHPQISDLILAQRAFQRALRVRRALRSRAVRHGDGP
ncbi:NUMOD4 domain-containing protein [Corynebacterium sp. SCR221107]|uniref:NUMOD4 domain-containing protein n=1 Tax=Corynebacterium sp. SCR221107 TaxID=3017361 RepID=UPI0022EC4EA4|nr:HNH endonuclease [Corynebacterium sp. SCR221107]WBT08124.1 NUMOD4 domain-containing protein [Corynebacterium sp. SCR221107]